MEAFEHVVKVYLEAQGYVVTAGVKFPVRRRNRTGKPGEAKYQTHGYEVDLVAAKSGSLLLASVKSFFGSAGVHRQGFKKLADPSKRTHYPRYQMLTDAKVRRGILKGASRRYGYPPTMIRMALFVGKFHKPDEAAVRKYLSGIRIPAGTVEVFGLDEVVPALLDLAKRRTYIDDPVIVTLKMLNAANVL